MNNPLDALRHHVTGAIERGEATAIEEKLKMKLTHYAIRDLHAVAPDDEEPGTYDVLAKAEDGRVFYTEDVMMADEAKDFVALMLVEPYEFDYWEDKPVDAPYVGEVSWVAA